MKNILLPSVGASIRIFELSDHLDWILEGQRDLEFWDACLPEVLDGDWPSLVRQARSILEGYQGRLGIHGPWEGMPLLCRDKRVRELVVFRLKQALDFAASLGATHMVLHSPFEFYGSPQLAHTPEQGLNREIDLVHVVLDQVLPQASEIGCALALEVSYDTHPAALLALVRSFDSPWVRFSLDTGHALVLQRIGGPPPEQWIKAAGELLAHVHLTDNDGLLDRHWPPGEGNVNWTAVFSVLQQMENLPRLIMEVPSAKLAQGAGWLFEHNLAR